MNFNLSPAGPSHIILVLNMWRFCLPAPWGDTWQYMTTSWDVAGVGAMILQPIGQRPGMLLNLLKCPRQQSLCPNKVWNVKIMSQLNCLRQKLLFSLTFSCIYKAKWTHKLHISRNINHAKINFKTVVSLPLSSIVFNVLSSL
jgi:hypothetical protein